jgi:hypothetical protein
MVDVNRRYYALHLLDTVDNAMQEACRDIQIWRNTHMEGLDAFSRAGALVRGWPRNAEAYTYFVANIDGFLRIVESQFSLGDEALNTLQQFVSRLSFLKGVVEAACDVLKTESMLDDPFKHVTIGNETIVGGPRLRFWLQAALGGLSEGGGTASALVARLVWRGFFEERKAALERAIRVFDLEQGKPVASNLAALSEWLGWVSQAGTRVRSVLALARVDASAPLFELLSRACGSRVPLERMSLAVALKRLDRSRPAPRTWKVSAMVERSYCLDRFVHVDDLLTNGCPLVALPPEYKDVSALEATYNRLYAFFALKDFQVNLKVTPAFAGKCHATVVSWASLTGEDADVGSDSQQDALSWASMGESKESVAFIDLGAVAGRVWPSEWRQVSSGGVAQDSQDAVAQDSAVSVGHHSQRAEERDSQGQESQGAVGQMQGAGRVAVSNGTLDRVGTHLRTRSEVSAAEIVVVSNHGGEDRVLHGSRGVLHGPRKQGAVVPGVTWGIGVRDKGHRVVVHIYCMSGAAIRAIKYLKNLGHVSASVGKQAALLQAATYVSGNGFARGVAAFTTRFRRLVATGPFIPFERSVRYLGATVRGESVGDADCLRVIVGVLQIPDGSPVAWAGLDEPWVESAALQLVTPSGALAPADAFGPFLQFIKREITSEDGAGIRGEDSNQSCTGSGKYRSVCMFACTWAGLGLEGRKGVPEMASVWVSYVTQGYTGIVDKCSETRAALVECGLGSDWVSFFAFCQLVRWAPDRRVAKEIRAQATGWC